MHKDHLLMDFLLNEETDCNETIEMETMKNSTQEGGMENSEVRAEAQF